MEVAVIGLGNMGSRIAQCILDGGFDLTVWNRTASKMEPLVALESQTVPGTFIVVERWESDAALDAHREAEAITTVYLPHIMPLVDRVLHVCSVLPGT